MTILRRLLGRRAYQLLLGILLLVALLYQGETGGWLELGAPADPAPVSATQDEARVVRVIDGDTFEIEGGERVRLIGIDTPESVKPDAPVECFGKESSEYLKSLIEGKVVRLDRDRTDRDRYARLLRYAYLGDISINERLVREGYAESVAYPPDTRLQVALDLAEQAAKAEQRGRWSEGVCP